MDNFSRNKFQPEFIQFCNKCFEFESTCSQKDETTADHKPYFSITLILISIYKLLNEVKIRTDLLFQIYKLFGRVQPALTLFCSVTKMTINYC